MENIRRNLSCRRRASGLPRFHRRADWDGRERRKRSGAWRLPPCSKPSLSCRCKTGRRRPERRRRARSEERRVGKECRFKRPEATQKKKQEYGTELPPNPGTASCPDTTPLTADPVTE